MSRPASQLDARVAEIFVYIPRMEVTECGYGSWRTLLGPPRIVASLASKAQKSSFTAGEHHDNCP